MVVFSCVKFVLLDLDRLECLRDFRYIFYFMREYDYVVIYIKRLLKLGVFKRVIDVMLEY